MKTKITLIISVMAALAIGFWVGHVQASSSWSHKYWHDYYERSAADSFIYAKMLTDLRGGHQENGVSLLEQHLDLSLSRFDQVPEEQRTDFVLTDLRVARDYRVEHPWQETSPKFGESVHRVLSSVK